MRQWEERLVSAMRRERLVAFNRAVAIEETGSTQDAAFERAGGKAGLVLVADRQTSGRGRLGRAWFQGGFGLAMTCVVDAERVAAARLSLAAGVATANALDGLLPGSPGFGLRWPNDVVEPRRASGNERKVAGVLIEVRSGLALVGIGVNVLQEERDFPDELRGRAVSLKELGSTVARIDLAERVMIALERAAQLAEAAVSEAWLGRDVLIGTSQAFMVGPSRVEGVVEAIDPTREIVVRTASGSLEQIPAMTALRVPTGPDRPLPRA